MRISGALEVNSFQPLFESAGCLEAWKHIQPAKSWGVNSGVRNLRDQMPVVALEED